MKTFLLKVVGLLIFTGICFAMLGAYRHTESVQRGYPGLGMELTESIARLAARTKANEVPPALPPASQDGQLAVDAYKNVQVLGHITSGEMTRLMTAMTIWVAPKQGCAYCHAHAKDAGGKEVFDEDGSPLADQNNLGSDELYTKRVARRMLQMTMHINSDWKTHVKETGVTCYTCHRGNPVPTYIWYNQPDGDYSGGTLGNHAGQNTPSMVTGLTALPVDPFRPFLSGDEGIRVLSTEALPIDNRSSIKQTEWTYALMMHFSTALGVNCTHCHNTRSMAAWSASPPARTQAWYGIRMVRDLNNAYLESQLGNFPPERLGAMGDVPKINCTTCHQNAYKPLLGVSMLKDYMVLAEAKPQPQKTVVAPPTPPIEAIPGTPGAPGTTGAAVPPGTVVAPGTVVTPGAAGAPGTTVVPSVPVAPGAVNPTGARVPPDVPVAPVTQGTPAAAAPAVKPPATPAAKSTPIRTP